MKFIRATIAFIAVSPAAAGEDAANPELASASKATADFPGNSKNANARLRGALSAAAGADSPGAGGEEGRFEAGITPITPEFLQGSSDENTQCIPNGEVGCTCTSCAPATICDTCVPCCPYSSSFQYYRCERFKQQDGTWSDPDQPGRCGRTLQLGSDHKKYTFPTQKLGETVKYYN